MKSLKNQIVAPLLVALTLTTSACATQVAPAVSVAPAAAAQSAVLKIVATDHHYMMPSEIKAGYVNMVMENAGKEPHHAQFLRLNDGVSMVHLGMIMPYSVE
jgi:hypothetical protein